MKVDTGEILRLCALMAVRPGHPTELRALEATTRDNRRPRTIFGFFDDPAKLAAAVEGIATAKGIYFTPNPGNPALLARAHNRLRDAGKSDTTGDAHITARWWFPIDADAVRPAGISATDAEHEAAIDRVCAIRSELTRMGWPEPIIGDSGNGGHLLYRVDLSADDGGLIERCLDALAALYGDDDVAIDRSVHNPARIWKLYGTMACKGDDTPERPHRLAKIIDAPAALVTVTREQLEALAAQAPAKETPAIPRRVNGNAGDCFAWLDSFLDRNAGNLPPMTGPENYQGGRRWIFEQCPFNPEHRNGSAFLIQRADGVIQAGCHHNGCKDENWHTLRAMVEPRPARETPAHGSANGGFGSAGNAGNADGGSPPVPFVAFPVEVLPRVLADLVSAGAKALGCDPSQIALPMLVACSGAIGNSRRIALKESWKEPAVIWAVTVLPSGALKSPALDLALANLRRVQGEAIRDYKEQMVRHEADVSDWEHKDKKTRGDRPAAPVCPRIVVSDVTVEGLASILSQQASGRGILCERDEASGWLKSFNQYKAKGGADEAHWLTMHRAGGLTMDRKTGDERLIYCPRAFVSFTGTIQPGVLRRALLPEYRESGLLARLLLAMPPVTRRRWSEAVVSEAVRTRYGALLAGLLALPMGGVLGDPQPIDLPLTPDAKALWVDFYNAHNASEQASEGGDIAAAWSKLEGYAARLALILHCARAVSGEADPAAVDAVSMAGGIALARWFGGEAERVYAALGDDPAEDELTALARYIADRGGRMTARELRDGPRRYRPDGAARDALCRLVEAGGARWIMPAPGRAGGRPSEVCELISAAPEPPRPETARVCPAPETPRHDSAGEGFAGGGGAGGAIEGGFAGGGEDDRDFSAGAPDEGIEVRS